MQALLAHYKGDTKLDVQATKAQQKLDTLMYITIETMITWLNKAYIVLKKHGQEFMDKSKVEYLAKCIRNPWNNIQITMAVKTMCETHKANYTMAVQHITSGMVQINSASLNTLGPNPWCINERNSNKKDAPWTEVNGVNICNPFCTFTELKLTCLGERG